MVGVWDWVSISASAVMWGFAQRIRGSVSKRWILASRRISAPWAGCRRWCRVAVGSRMFVSARDCLGRRRRRRWALWAGWGRVGARKRLSRRRWGGRNWWPVRAPWRCRGPRRFWIGAGIALWRMGWGIRGFGTRPCCRAGIRRRRWCRGFRRRSRNLRSCDGIWITAFASRLGGLPIGVGRVEVGGRGKGKRRAFKAQHSKIASSTCTENRISFPAHCPVTNTDLEATHTFPAMAVSTHRYQLDWQL